VRRFFAALNFYTHLNFKNAQANNSLQTACEACIGLGVIEVKVCAELKAAKNRSTPKAFGQRWVFFHKLSGVRVQLCTALDFC